MDHAPPAKRRRTAGVTETYAMDGETLVLTIADIATGTSFTEKRSKV